VCIGRRKRKGNEGDASKGVDGKKGPKRRKGRKRISTKPRHYLEVIHVEVKGEGGPG
jgi:hypothetical protein